jgi:carbamoyl-phosphate synthase large subunit
VSRVAKVSEGEHNVAVLIRNGRVDMVINTPFGRGPRTDGYFIRTAAAAAGVPCITTLPGVFAAVRGIEALRGTPTEPRSIQEHHATAAAGPAQARLTFDEAEEARAAGEGIA